MCVLRVHSVCFRGGYCCFCFLEILLNVCQPSKLWVIDHSFPFRSPLRCRDFSFFFLFFVNFLLLFAGNNRHHRPLNMTEEKRPSGLQAPAPVPAYEPQEGYMKKILRYAFTRVPTLIPPMNPAPSPFKALTLLSKQQWLFFGVCLPKSYDITLSLIIRWLSLAGHGTPSISSPSP